MIPYDEKIPYLSSGECQDRPTFGNDELTPNLDPPPFLPPSILSMAPPSKEPLWASLTAGVLAGAIEGVVTYPTEFVKTQSQFASQVKGEKVSSRDLLLLLLLSLEKLTHLLALLRTWQPPGPIQIIKTTLATKGPLGLYAGCGALVVGNAVKAGVRFLSYDHYKSLLQDDNVSTNLYTFLYCP